MALGKTNITALSEGAIVTEIEDYKWIQMQSGIYGNFIKAVYKNDYLVAITADGKIAYTTDGEVWQTSVLEYEACKLNDVEWDGSRFLFAGSYTNAGKKTGLIIETTDFEDYSVVRSDDTEQEFLIIFPTNGKYITLGISSNIKYYIGNLLDEWEKSDTIGGGYVNTSTYAYSLSVTKNTNGILISCIDNRSETGTSVETYYVHKVTSDGQKFRIRSLTSKSNAKNVFAFECHDNLLYISTQNTDNYRFVKVLDSGEEIILSTDVNYMFVDGVYFNNCDLFINNHEMLVVKKGESIADKTLDDLIEIAPELTMNCITKAFGQLFIFGNQGAILKSSVETNNEEAVTVQTLSAKKALAEAKAYADQQIAALEARVAILEQKSLAPNTTPETE